MDTEPMSIDANDSPIHNGKKEHNTNNNNHKDNNNVKSDNKESNTEEGDELTQLKSSVLKFISSHNEPSYSGSSHLRNECNNIVASVFDPYIQV